MNLDFYRQKIDETDDEICRLFQQRMDIVDQVGQYKREKGIPVDNSSRERQVLTRISKQLRPDLEDFGRSLYRSIFDISKAYEAMHKEKDSPLYREISALISAEPAPFPKRASVACQGREGAFSQMAAEQFFEVPEIMFNNSFEGVIKMVTSGMCEFGVLPIENSNAGSVNEIYDLLVKYDVHIVRSTRLRVDHQLLAAPGTDLAHIRKVLSHPQALSQCSHFLSKLPDIELIPFENTAMAAQQVASDDSHTLASISSKSCAVVYGLDVLASDISNSDNNHTRFICISHDVRIYPGSDRTSIMMILPHKPGSLFGVLSRFNAVGANLLKLESRPMPGRDFEFVFYFDIEMSVYNPKFASLISELDHSGETFRYLGTYLESF